MTSQMTQLQKPALPPKPTKYRAPLPPTSSAQSALRCSTSSASSSSSAASVRREQTAGGKKCRAPAPPTARPPVPPPLPPATSTSPAPCKPAMRREPMQVCPSSVTSYERSLSSSAATSSSTTSDCITVNGPRSASITVKLPSRQHSEPLHPPVSLHVRDGVVDDSESLEPVKPIIRDVKLCPRNSAVTSSTRTQRQQQRTVRSWRSTESIDRLITSATTTAADGGGSGGRGAVRSSFMDPSPSTVAAAGRRSVYIDLGEYQTLLKHGRQDAVYSLPQPHCYGNETLRAVKLITEKYDTFKRRQMRALSFRDAAAGGGAGPVKTARQQSHTDDNTIAEDDERPVPVDSTAETSVSHTETSTPTNSRPLMTLSRPVVMLSACELDSISSLYDVTCPPETDVVDFSDLGVTRTDRLRIEMFYRSRETDIYVCSCLADLFVGAVAAGGATGRWVHVHTGVPVWLLSSGRGVRRRKLMLAVAERQTGVPLWQDRITYLSNYAQADDGDASDDASHVMRPSSNLSSAVRITMFNRRSAAAFLERFHRFTADPVDDLWKISDDQGAAAGTRGGWLWKRRRRRGRDPAPSKDSVSQPFHVIHMSRVDLKHPSIRAAFAHLLPPPTSSPPPSAATSTAVSCPAAPPPPPAVDSQPSSVDETDAEQFRPRLPTR